MQPTKFDASTGKRLARFLGAPERPKSTMSYPELAGFLFSVASSPEMIMPSEWLSLIFDEEGAGYEDEDEARRVLNDIMGLYNWINAGIFDGDPRLPQGCEARQPAIDNFDDQAPLCQWSRGFMQGHEWLIELWNSCLPDEMDEELGASTLVLSFFTSRQLADAYRTEFKAPFESVEDMAELQLKLMNDAMASYANLGRSIAEAMRSVPEPAVSTKVGRNEPCPCGSGKKYKKCCGMTH